MSRLVKILALCTAAVAVAAATAACGTQNIDVPKSQSALYHGAVLFSQRCAGCHTLSYAATNGSAPNVRTAQANSGPNFNQRCERPIDRVLYAIENGGFSGAYMPQNVVVGQDAVDVARFVATYAGRQAPAQVGIINCQQRPLGTLPPGSGQVAAGSSSGSGGTSTTAASVSTGTPSTEIAAVPAPRRRRSAKAKRTTRS
jgi:mono/diheme cytochrome c family protein